MQLGALAIIEITPADATITSGSRDCQDLQHRTLAVGLSPHRETTSHQPESPGSGLELGISTMPGRERPSGALAGKRLRTLTEIASATRAGGGASQNHEHGGHEQRRQLRDRHCAQRPHAMPMTSITKSPRSARVLVDSRAKSGERPTRPARKRARHAVDGGTRQSAPPANRDHASAPRLRIARDGRQRLGSRRRTSPPSVGDRRAQAPPVADQSGSAIEIECRTMPGRACRARVSHRVNGSSRRS